MFPRSESCLGPRVEDVGYRAILKNTCMRFVYGILEIGPAFQKWGVTESRPLKAAFPLYSPLFTRPDFHLDLGL